MLENAPLLLRLAHVESKLKLLSAQTLERDCKHKRAREKALVLHECVLTPLKVFEVELQTHYELIVYVVFCM